MEITANRYIKNDGTLDPFHWSSGVASKKEIDYFLALNGINMPLAIVGTEAVWYDDQKRSNFLPRMHWFSFCLSKKASIQIIPSALGF